MSGTFQPKNTASTSARTHGGTSPVATGPIADTRPGLIDIKWFEQGSQLIRNIDLTSKPL